MVSQITNLTPPPPFHPERPRGSRPEISLLLNDEGLACTDCCSTTLVLWNFACDMSRDNGSYGLNRSLDVSQTQREREFTTPASPKQKITITDK